MSNEKKLVSVDELTPGSLIDRFDVGHVEVVLWNVPTTNVKCHHWTADLGVNCQMCREGHHVMATLGPRGFRQDTYRDRVLFWLVTLAHEKGTHDGIR